MSSFNEEVLNNLKNLFEETVEFAYNLFEEKAFWLHRNREEKWFHYERPTKILYDPLMQVLANNLDKKEQVMIKRQEIINGLENFHKIKYDAFKGRDTNKTKVTDRIQILNEYINSFLNE